MPATPQGAAKAKNPTGRPSTFTRAKADRICRELAEGISLVEICRTLAIPISTIYHWGERKDPATAGFRKALARARVEQAHTLFSQALEIADDGTNDWEERQGKNGHTFIALNTEAVQRSKLRVETRLKMAALMAPATYGQKVTTLLGNATGEDGKPIPFQTEARVVDAAGKALEALRAKLKKPVTA